LKGDPWGSYFEAVYGQIPDSGYPLNLGDFWMLYDDALQAVKDLPAIVSTCPPGHPAKGTHYRKNNVYSPSYSSWIWHPYPYGQHEGWVEVMRKKDPFGDEHFGAWFVYAKGSGIYFNIGKTISFGTHEEAYQHFKVQGPHWNEEMCKNAAAMQYDSVQFTAHKDSTNYPCSRNAGLAYMNMEIVGVKLTGTYACGAQDGAPDSIRVGWRHSRPCHCDPHGEFLNCKGVPVAMAMHRAPSQAAMVFV